MFHLRGVENFRHQFCHARQQSKSVPRVMLCSEVPLMRTSLASLAFGDHAADHADDDPEWSQASERLAALKRRVPQVVASVGHRAWSSATSRGGYKHQTDGLVASRAYHKMQEIVLTCGIEPPHRSAHLCEAPGGFVQAIGERAPDDWEWVAVTLPDGIEMSTLLLPMRRGRCVYADVADVDVPSLLGGDGGAGRYDLVTADGANDVNHERLEDEHLRLLVAQTLCAFRILRLGGTAVVKFFEGSDVRTRRWLAWMAQTFKHVSVLKPTSSRPTNSERYCVGRSFLGTPHDIRTPEDLTRAFTSNEWDAHARGVLREFHANQSRALERAFEVVRGGGGAP